MNYDDQQLSIFMDTGNFKESITLYIKLKRDFKKNDCPGMILTRKMAYALMNEIKARLFDDSKVKHGLLKAKDSDSIFK